MTPVTPSEGFWEGVGESVGNSPGWLLVAAALIFAIVFVVVKYIIPSQERIKMRKLEIEEKQAANDADRIKANAQLADQQRQTNILIDGMRQTLEASTAHTDVLVAELQGSRDRSKEMGEEVRHVRTTTDHTNDLVEQIHSVMVRREGTD